MKTKNVEEQMNIGLIVVTLALFITLLIMSFVGDYRREQEAIPEYTPEQWVAFQNCIDPYPSDYVCDSCWKAIIEVKHTNK